MFAVDAGSTQAVGQIDRRSTACERKAIKAGGYDLLPTTLKLIQKGQLDFTIDQQPYLQGWLPVLQLFLYKYPAGLVAPSDTNTGLLFVTKANVKPYLTTKTRYEGSSQRTEVSRLVTRDRGRRQQPRPPEPPQRASLGWRVAGAFVRRREASIGIVAARSRRLLLAANRRVLRTSRTQDHRRVRRRRSRSSPPAR